MKLMKTIQKFYRKNAPKIVTINALAQITIFILIIIFLGVAKSQHNTYNPQDTQIKFSPDKLYPLTLADKETRLVQGVAKVDLNEMNSSVDPELIKDYIKEIAPEYGLDWKLVYAIGAYESGYFKSNLAQSQNNFFGRKATSTTWMSWETPEEAIHNQMEYLKTRYIERGLDTPEEMNRVYCEGDTWKYKVRHIMNTTEA